MAGLRIAIVGTPIGDQKLGLTLSVEPEDLTPEEIALVLRDVVEQLDTGRMVGPRE